VIGLTLTAWDWVFVVWSLAVVVGVGTWYGRRANRSIDEYFLSGRDLPWWALGTSMVATTFAADTPIVVGDLVVRRGVAGNWLWWSFLFGSALTVCLFSRWWRRAGVTTEIELLELRYDGAPARGLRGFKAIYLGLVLNSIVIGWVTKAMLGILTRIFPELPPGWILAALLALTFAYTTLSGLWGVVATDVLQFAVAMVGSILLAVLAVGEVGGLPELVARAREVGDAHGRDLLSILPRGDDLFASGVAVLVLVNWWAVYYPGVEPGGGGYVAQRMLAAKDERHARAGTLWFVFAHYVLRPWPWILVALAAIVLQPEYLAASGAPPADGAYPGMFRLLPEGLRGLVVASFLAAYMSTITTQLNLAASYLVNDLWRPFLRGPGATPRHEVAVARLAVVVVTAAGGLVSWQLVTAGKGWSVLMELTAGTGIVLILRWLWWRVNAWSEIAAMAGSALGYVAARTAVGSQSLAAIARAWHGLPPEHPVAEATIEPIRLLAIVLCSALFWLPCTLLTRPVPAAKLAAFFGRIRPGGWWGPVARASGLPVPSLGAELRQWLFAIALVMGGLIGLGSALLLDFRTAFLAGAVALAGGVLFRLALAAEDRRPESA
jgi:Na+/proline symporter